MWDISQYLGTSKKGQMHYPAPVIILDLEETSASQRCAFPREALQLALTFCLWVRTVSA